MTVPKGAVTYKVRKEIDDLRADFDNATLLDTIAAADISDSTSVGRAILTAASAAAVRTAAGSQQAFVSAPASATAAGTTGQIAWDATHFYVCINTNVWVRATLATW